MLSEFLGLGKNLVRLISVTTVLNVSVKASPMSSDLNDENVLLGEACLRKTRNRTCFCLHRGWNPTSEGLLMSPKLRVIRPPVLIHIACRVRSPLLKSRATLRQCLWNVLQTFIALLQTLPASLSFRTDERTVWPVFGNRNWSAVTDQSLKSRSLLSVINLITNSKLVFQCNLVVVHQACNAVRWL